MGRFALRKEEAASLLKNRPFLRLATAQFSATMAIYGLSFAGVALVEERTHSTAQTGLVIVSSILPAFFGSLVAGAAVDRWGRVRALVASHLVRVLIGLAFWGGTTLLPEGLALTTVYVANGVGAGLAQFALSAELSLLPNVVGQESLIPANGLFQLGMLAGEGLGIVVVVPLIIKLAGAPWMGLVSALLCLLALALVAGLPGDRPAPDRVQADRPRWSNVRADLQAGWHTISRDRLLALVTIQATLAASLLLVLLSLVPGMAARHLGLSAEDTPFLMLPGGLGFVLGAALMSRWQGRFSRPGWIALGLIILGLSVSLLAVLLGADSAGGAVLGLILAAILAIGLSLALAIIPARAVLQERPPAAVRGRVIAAQLALANAAAVLPLLVGGALADSFGIRPVMALLGLLALGSGGIGLRHALT
jgi:MFS family permease